MDVELHQLELRYAGLRRRDARKERALVASLSEVGQQVPVVVVAGGEGRWVLVDGYKRVRALERLAQDTVRVAAWQVEEAEALMLERLMRAAEGDSALEQGWLLRELHERFGLSHEELARRFDKSQSWVSRRLGLVEVLPEEVQEWVRRGELVAHAVMKHLLPMARAKRQECVQLAAALAGRRLSSRQVGTLCAAWQSSAEAARELLLKDPLLVLRAQQASQAQVERSPTEKLLRDVAALAPMARRARRRLADGLRLRPDEACALRQCAEAARAEVELLITTVKKEEPDAGRGDAGGDSEAA
jgi:ParB/RepB/Spo0J family partition protein